MSTVVWPSIAAAQAQARRLAAAPLVWDPVEHLLARCTFGATSDDRAQLAQLGPDAWYQQQVTAATTYAGYAGRPEVAALYPMLAMSPYDTRQALIGKGEEYGWDAMDALSNVTLALQGWGPAQLYEVLVDFFSNHLNVPNHNGDVWTTRHCYDRDVIRRYATGSFTDLLIASSKDPAMLSYLDLADSTKNAVNENYAREMLERHTVGLHYTESDVQNCARLLTGRTTDRNYHYLFDDYVHATGPVKVLGFSTANASAAAGEQAGDDLLRYLAAHKWTAQNLAHKLCVRFVSDTPSVALVNAVAKAYHANRTQILPMVSTILRSTEFWESRGRKVRRPAENVLATVRTLGIGVTDWTKALPALMWVTRVLGQSPLDWPAPDGYPDVAASWRSASTLLSSWNYHLGFVGGWFDGFTDPDVNSYYGVYPATSGEAVAKLTQRLTGQAWSPTHLAALQTYLGEPSTTAMSASVLRWLAPQLAGLALDAPHFALR